jgi:hypothetical protein
VLQHDAGTRTRSAVCPALVHLALNIGGLPAAIMTALLATEERAWWLPPIMIRHQTEISLIHRGDILSASCPSGPALEGGHISCGMRAAEGAIERVAVEDGRIRIHAIGNRKPIGLCGSGVIDAMAALRELGILDDGGRIIGRHPDIADVDGKRVVVLAPCVTFNQHDVRAVQLAKAAIRTGIELLLRDRGVHEYDIALVVIAGAFGSILTSVARSPSGCCRHCRATASCSSDAAGLGVRQISPRGGSARANSPSAAAVELSTRGDFRRLFYTTSASINGVCRDEFARFRIGKIGDRSIPVSRAPALLDAEDLAGVQALAVRQVEAPARSTLPSGRGSTDFEFLAKVVRAIQTAVSVPLCFDSQRAGAGSSVSRPMTAPAPAAARPDQFDHRTALGFDGPL